MPAAIERYFGSIVTSEIRRDARSQLVVQLNGGSLLGWFVDADIMARPTRLGVPARLLLMLWLVEVAVPDIVMASAFARVMCVAMTVVVNQH